MHTDWCSLCESSTSSSSMLVVDVQNIVSPYSLVLLMVLLRIKNLVVDMLVDQHQIFECIVGLDPDSSINLISKINLLNHASSLKRQRFHHLWPSMLEVNSWRLPACDQWMCKFDQEGQLMEPSMVARAHTRHAIQTQI